MPVGGEFIMPPEVAKAALEEIYGEGPDLQNIDLEELEDDTPIEEEVKDLERLRRKWIFPNPLAAAKKPAWAGPRSLGCRSMWAVCRRRLPQGSMAM